MESNPNRPLLAVALTALFAAAQPGCGDDYPYYYDDCRYDPGRCAGGCARGQHCGHGHTICEW